METLSVTQLNTYIKANLEGDPTFHNVQVMGEISNFKNHSSGHFYFTLKDNQSRVNAVMFATYARKVKIKLEDGMKVIIKANIGVYLNGGTYQLYAFDIEPIGVGNLYLQFEELKKKLANEGLFAEENKKIIPKFPLNIGVISAKEGAAIQDVITTIQRRWPITKITLIPSLVQGKSATKAVCNALIKADSLNFDTIIVARGGGSIEDLWCFNEEEVARTVFAMKTPIISAIGHETDFTIIDFVSDRRAPTPTGAAEIATPNLEDVITYFEQQKARIIKAQRTNLDNLRTKLSNLATSKTLKRPELLYAEKQLQLNYLQQRLVSIKDKTFIKTSAYLDAKKQELKQKLLGLIQNSKHRHQTCVAKLDMLSPLKVLTRGYSITSINEKPITSVTNVKIEDEISILLKDGKLKAKVTNKEVEE